MKIATKRRRKTQNKSVECIKLTATKQRYEHFWGKSNLPETKISTLDKYKQEKYYNNGMWYK